jgi:hypothetical protein
VLVIRGKLRANGPQSGTRHCARVRPQSVGPPHLVPDSAQGCRPAQSALFPMAFSMEYHPWRALSRLLSSSPGHDQAPPTGRDTARPDPAARAEGPVPDEPRATPWVHLCRPHGAWGRVMLETLPAFPAAGVRRFASRVPLAAGERPSPGENCGLKPRRRASYDPLKRCLATTPTGETVGIGGFFLDRSKVIQRDRTSLLRQE